MRKRLTGKFKSTKDVIDFIAERQKKTAELRKAGSPEVGIIYVVDGKLFIDGTPINMAESYGDALIHDNDHIKYWKSLGSIDPKYRQIPYEFYPRGRVAYDKTNRTFYMYLDKCILKDKKMISKIKEEMHLGKTVVRTDDHYKCKGCGWKDLE